MSVPLHWTTTSTWNMFSPTFLISWGTLVPRLVFPQENLYFGLRSWGFTGVEVGTGEEFDLQK